MKRSHVVDGWGRGVGRAIVERLVAEGSSLVIPHMPEADLRMASPRCERQGGSHGHRCWAVLVDPDERTSYLAGCVPVVEQAREAAGCLDFSISADLVKPDRINILERWESQMDVEAFRGSGPSGEQGAAMLAASVAEYDVAAVRQLT